MGGAANAEMKIAYITAGAAGMFCGSCMRDNTLTAALRELGHDALLIPTYTPIRTDEADVSDHRVFFGGVNVFLQEKLGFFRHTPWFLDRLLDAPRLLRWVSRFAATTQASDLGDLTLSMLRGQHGRQHKEFDKLTAWLRDDLKPDLIVLTNMLLSGMIPAFKNALGKPIVAMLQGDDIFLEALPAAARRDAIELIRRNGESCSGYIATCIAYADFMSEYLGVPRERIDVVYPGIRLDGYDAIRAERPAGHPFTVGYFARICPEKGLHLLVDAIGLLKRWDSPVRLRIGGWLGEQNRAYFREQEAKAERGGWRDAFEHVDCPSHGDKLRFLRSIDVLSVPTTYREPKGLYILEAWASGVPVVQPAHGSFPEWIAATGGGLLFPPNDAGALAEALRSLIDDPVRAAALGRSGQAAVRERFHAAAMARETARVLEKHGFAMTKHE